MLELGLFNRSRVALVRQTELSECGLACLTMIANFHGQRIDLGTMRRRFTPSLRGASLRSVMELADSIGLVPRAVKLPLEKLDDLHLPAILHWGLNHYVVLERVKGSKMLIHNPSGRSAWLPTSDVSNYFTGVALEIRVGDNFSLDKQRTRLKLSQLWGRMTGLKSAILQTIVLSLILEAFVLASPYYMQLAVDSALPASDGQLLLVLALGFGLFAIINAAASLLRSFVLLVAGTTIGFNVATNVARRLFRLPVSWFERRNVGDVLSRFQSITPIQKMLSEGAVAGIIDGSLAVVTLALMFFYSAKLAIVALLAFGTYALIRWLSYSALREAQEASLIFRGRESSTLIETLRGITTLRLFGQETMRHGYWQTRLAEAVNADIRSSRITIWVTSSSVLVFGLEIVVSIWMSINAVISGDGFSLGMAFAYLAYKAQFIQKASSLIDQSIAFRMLGLHLERLSDIALSDEDAGFDEYHDDDGKLQGKVEVRNLSYRYSPSDNLVLDDVSLLIQPGEHVAITGPSGGGKSTLMKILLGLLIPDEGQLLVDDKPIQIFGYRRYRTSVAAVLQEDTLFTGSLADNIALFDETPDMNKIHEAAIAASIHDDILKMPMRYETLVGDMGSSLSGGQKQRIFLARALYRRPKILFMDEGTAHLDAKHEQAVNGAISAMGITRIVIAHRKETIEAADRVLTMFNGKLLQGTDREEAQNAQS